MRTRRHSLLTLLAFGAVGAFGMEQHVAAQANAQSIGVSGHLPRLRFR